METKRLKKILILTLSFVLVFGLFSCGDKSQDGKKTDVEKGDTEQSEEPIKSPEELLEERVQEIMASMTLEEKVGQMLLPMIEQLKDDRQTVLAVDDEIREKVEKYKPCGVILFAKNIETEEQIKALNSDLATLGEIPMFIAVDEEGGAVSRFLGKGFSDVPETPRMYEIGKSGDFARAEKVGSTIGHYLKDYGFNLDFAPIADCFTNPNNTVIGPRSFGADPDINAKMVSSVIDGLHGEGIPTCIKHYPGHGDTSTDTHSQVTYVKKTWDELLSLEIIPFKENLESTDMVMASHIVCTNIDPDHPTSLSKIMIQEKLRDELGFNGVVITDSMKMQAVSKVFNTDTAAVLLVNAGVDIMLMPNNFEKAYDAILAAVNSGRIRETRIDESVARILRVKLKYLYK